ncbi:MAG TPA: hypothetical protein VE954_25890 [Oligoflexus sp.]|uniref:hypothetical protein n=1 Tax=Oligoflexus sp. TaxID=1971216 RepID=UPI002D62B1DE|nr:hypothetical protein [Oligoflexus sp.]HYX36555.1 hypothetical protein [Oligoflexus sp.]
MLNIGQSRVLHVATTLIALNLLATACGGDSRKKSPQGVTHVEFHGPTEGKPTAVPTPEVSSTPTLTPAPEGGSTPEVAPTATPIPTPEAIPTPVVTPTAVPTPEGGSTPEPTPKQPLPAASELSAEEKLQYLTNDEPFTKLPTHGLNFRGTGYDVNKSNYRGDCMEPSIDTMDVTRDARPHEEYTLMPLSSLKQVKSALSYQGYPLYPSGLIDFQEEKKLAVVAIAKKIRKLEFTDSLVLKEKAKAVSPERFEQWCGQFYQKGEVYGHIFYSVMWIDLDDVNTKERVLSRLIDSQRMGTYTNVQDFVESLQSFTSQLVDTENLYGRGGVTGYNSIVGQPVDLRLDLGSMLKAWSAAADQVELAKVPAVGAIFSKYPDRSTPVLTGETSQ